jgi:hypothetical protein
MQGVNLMYRRLSLVALLCERCTETIICIYWQFHLIHRMCVSGVRGVTLVIKRGINIMGAVFAYRYVSVNRDCKVVCMYFTTGNNETW